MHNRTLQMDKVTLEWSRCMTNIGFGITSATAGWWCVAIMSCRAVYLLSWAWPCVSLHVTKTILCSPTAAAVHSSHPRHRDQQCATQTSRYQMWCTGNKSANRHSIHDDFQLRAANIRCTRIAHSAGPDVHACCTPPEYTLETQYCTLHCECCSSARFCSFSLMSWRTCCARHWLKTESNQK